MQLSSICSTYMTTGCPARQAKAQNKEYLPKKTPLRRDHHSDLYDEFCKIVDMYVTEDRIREIQHSYDTQLSEALNQSTCSRAPKGIHYSSSTSLHDRINTMIGVHNEGNERFFCDLLGALRSTVDPVLLEYLRQRDGRKSTKQSYQKMGSVKLKRKINGEEEVARWIDEKTKEELGIIEYKTGIGLNPVEYEESISAAQKEQQRQHEMKCRSCGELGHFNKQNFMCRLNKKNQENAVKYAATIQGKSKEQDNILPPSTTSLASTATAAKWHDEVSSCEPYGTSSTGITGGTHDRLEAKNLWIMIACHKERCHCQCHRNKQQE